jgi:RNA polymerase sigma factor (TIGR02999 family)
MQDGEENSGDAGDSDFQDAHALLPLVYNELRQLAHQKMAFEKPGHTLQPTALVHEAYLRLTGAGQSGLWQNAGSFYAAAAEAMRRILVENARRKGRLKRGGNLVRVDLDAEEVAGEAPAEEVLAVDEATARLAETHPGHAELVKLRYFVGLPLKEAAVILGISERTAERRWTFARAWLLRELEDTEDADGQPTTR